MIGTSRGLKSQISMKWKYLNFIDYLLPIYILCTIPCFYLGLHYDFIFKGFTIVVTLVYIVQFGLNTINKAVYFTAFLLLITFSFLQYLYNDRPLACYLGEASNYVAAMLFFFIGATDDRPGRTFYEKLLLATVVVFVAGLVCYFFTPSWYVTRNLELINARSSVEYNEVNVLDQMRFNAFFGDSYYVSHLSVFAAAIAIFDFAKYDDRNKYISLLFLFVAIISSVASMHRASMLGCLICLGVYVYYNYRVHKTKDNFVFGLSILILVIGFFMFIPNMDARLESIFGMVSERVEDNMSLNKALEERKFTQDLLASMRYYLFGHGLGSGGVIVRSYGFIGVADMQYVKMFFENGIMGFILFVGIIFRFLKRGIKYIDYYLTEVAIVLFVLVAMLGSNSLSLYYYIVYPFWYAIGRTYNNDYLSNLINCRWKY